ncbi:MAG: hypothetical protein WCQ72_08105, partial [Eubacteriales bacterium]
MNFKRILTALLLCALITSTFAACGSDSGGAAVQTSAAGTETVSADTSEAEVTRAPLDIPIKDYDGYTYKVLSYTQGDTGTWAQYLDFGW